MFCRQAKLPIRKRSFRIYFLSGMFCSQFGELISAEGEKQRYWGFWADFIVLVVDDSIFRISSQSALSER